MVYNGLIACRMRQENADDYGEILWKAKSHSHFYYQKFCFLKKCINIFDLFSNLL